MRGNDYVFGIGKTRHFKFGIMYIDIDDYERMRERLLRTALRSRSRDLSKFCEITENVYPLLMSEIFLTPIPRKI